MKNFLKSIFLVLVMTLPVIQSSAQYASLPPGGGPTYILDRVDVIFYADGSKDVINVCNYGPGFCGLD